MSTATTKTTTDHERSAGGSRSTADDPPLSAAPATMGIRACCGSTSRAARARTSSSRSPGTISWDEWFRKFDEAGLALVYQDEKASGEDSTFFKLVSR
jgi:hypothetical protein